MGVDESSKINSYEDLNNVMACGEEFLLVAEVSPEQKSMLLGQADILSSAVRDSMTAEFTQRFNADVASFKAEEKDAPTLNALSL